MQWNFLRYLGQKLDENFKFATLLAAMFSSVSVEKYTSRLFKSNATGILFRQQNTRFDGFCLTLCWDVHCAVYFRPLSYV